MARLTWLFPKKRGLRRTGSTLLGRVSEASFFLALFLLGFAGLAFVGWSLVARSGPVERHFASVHFRRVSAVVEEKRVVEVTTSEAANSFIAQLRVGYNDGGQPQSRWSSLGAPHAERASAVVLIDAWEIQQPVDIWLDPAQPQHPHIDPPGTWGLWLTIGLLVALAAAGGYGVIGTALAVGASAERRAALAQAAQPDIDLSDYDLPPARDYPTVPRDVNLLNSPGLNLKFRLPATQEPAWRLFAAAILVLSCSALAAALVVVALEQHLAGAPHWFLTCFAVLVFALAVWTILYFLRELIGATWFGPTTVEISEMPLWPGETLQIHVTQSGTLNVRRYRVLLVCDEETVYLQGTDIRHDQQRVHEQELFVRESFAIDAAGPLESYFPLTVPTDAMHSYKSKFNSINWKLVCEIQADDWPDNQRTYPLIVYPQPPTAADS